MNRVLLSGYYGFNNAGDETVLYAIIQTLRKIEPEIEIAVLSNQPEKTAQQYGVRAYNRWKFFDVVKALNNCDLLLSGGGSLLQDVTSSTSPLYYLGVIGLARFSGRPVMVYAQGIGPLKGRLNRRLAAWLLNRVQGITVRERGSREELLAMGVNKEITVTADPVLALSKEQVDLEKGRKILARNGVEPAGGQKILGIYIRPWQDNDYLEELATACDSLRRGGWQIVFVPMHFPGDIGVAKTVVKKMAEEAVFLKEHYDPEEILSLTGNMSVVLGMRLHALIDGAVMGVPLVALSYDPKVEGFMRQIGQHSLLPVTELRSQTLVDLVNWAYERRGEIAGEMAEFIKPVYQKAWQTARLAMSLLKEMKL